MMHPPDPPQRQTQRRAQAWPDGPVERDRQRRFLASSVEGPSGRSDLPAWLRFGIWLVALALTFAAGFTLGQDSVQRERCVITVGGRP